MNQPSTPSSRARLAGLEEIALLALARAGDAAAFGVLVARVRPRLLRMLVRMLGSRADADDVAQEACICALRAIKGFRGDAQFYTWLHGIARHLALAHLRSRRSAEAASVALAAAQAWQDGAGGTDAALPETALALRQLRAAVFDSVRALPPQLRCALVLREFSALRYEAIAHLLGCPVGTVRSRIARARTAVGRQLGCLAH